MGRSVSDTVKTGQKCWKIDFAPFLLGYYFCDYCLIWGLYIYLECCLYYL